MSASKPEDIVFSLKNHICLCTLMLQFSWGDLSGTSKLTAGKDRHFLCKKIIQSRQRNI